MGNPAATVDPKSLRQAWQRAITSVVAVPPEVLEPILCGLLARGHLLLEGPTGIGKKLLARTIASCIECEVWRVRLKKDMVPSNFVGTATWHADQFQSTFVPGPLFANLLLAEEIDKASPQVLSYLSEVMEADYVSVNGRNMELSNPFHVIATSNPIDHETSSMPKLALDNFLVCARLAHTGTDDKRTLMRGDDPEAALTELRPLLTKEQLIHAQNSVAEIDVREASAQYVLKTVVATREHGDVLVGASTRAALAWLRAAKARAWLEGRDTVLPSDLKMMAVPALAHRVFSRDEGEGTCLVSDVLASIVAPR